MSQTALNLVAIAIFTIMVSSLLGPLFNLSPTVPAIATFSLLALATLDTFSWKGQGGTLLLDWVASFSPQHRARIAHHEAGHFLVASLLEIPVTGYALSAWEAFKQGQSAQGGVSFDDQKLAEELAQGTLSSHILERYSIIWMSGLAAETIIYGNLEGGADDRQKLRTVLKSLGFSPSIQEQKERWAVLQAKTLLQANLLAYKALVDAMQQRTSVLDCHAVIKQHQPLVTQI